MKAPTCNSLASYAKGPGDGSRSASDTAYEKKRRRKIRFCSEWPQETLCKFEGDKS